MRVTTAFKRLLRLEGVRITAVEFSPAMAVTVALCRRSLVRPDCAHSTRTAYELGRPDVSRWRHLDLNVWRPEIGAHLRRLTRPMHGVRVEAVPFARPRSGITTDFEALSAFLATKADKTTISRPVRVDW